MMEMITAATLTKEHILCIGLILVGIITLVQFLSSQREHLLSRGRQALLDRRSVPIFEGTEVICVNAVGALVKGDRYKVSKLLLESNRLSINLPDGSEIHACADRFVVNQE